MLVTPPKRERVPIGKTGYFLSSSARERLGKTKGVEERQIFEDLQSERVMIASMDSAMHPEERPEMKSAYARHNARLTAERLRQMADMGGSSNEEMAHAINIYHRITKSHGPEYGDIYLNELRKMRIIARPLAPKK